MEDGIAAGKLEGIRGLSEFYVARPIIFSSMMEQLKRSGVDIERSDKDICYAIYPEKVLSSAEMAMFAVVGKIDALDALAMIHLNHKKPASFLETLLLIEICRLKNLDFPTKIAVLDCNWSRKRREKRFILLSRRFQSWLFILFGQREIIASDWAVPCVINRC